MKTINRLASFIKADHRYVYLGTSVIAALGLAFSQRNPTPLSFLAPTSIFQDCLRAILWAWLVVSAAAQAANLMHWSDYRETSPFASERFRHGARLGSYVVVAIAVIFFVDRCVMSFIDLVQVSIVSDSNPSDFLSSLVYMTYKSGDFFIRGIEVTIYATCDKDFTNEEVYELYKDIYKDEPFVKVFPANLPVQTKWAYGTNFVEMTPTFDSRTHRLIVSSVIDYIGKGAAGQAIQNMNLIMGLPETTGLMMPPMYP